MQVECITASISNNWSMRIVFICALRTNVSLWNDIPSYVKNGSIWNKNVINSLEFAILMLNSIWHLVLIENARWSQKVSYRNQCFERVLSLSSEKSHCSMRFWHMHMKFWVKLPLVSWKSLFCITKQKSWGLNHW